MNGYMNVIAVLIPIVLCIRHGMSFKFPTDITRCHAGDTNCIVESANAVIRTFYSGHRNINLLSLDPLFIPKIDIQQGEESPVNIRLLFTNNSIYGVKDFNIYQISGFQKDPEGKYEIRYKGPRLELVGPYKINGRILILPIQGEGRSNITLLDPDLLVKFTGKAVTKNNKVYLQPENVKLSFTLSKLIFDLGNLYNGDKVLGDNTNLFLNENWKEVFPELKKSVFEAFSQIVGGVLQGVFAKVPYEDLFIK